MGENVVIRDTCACGREYVVHQPEPGQKFYCMGCSREITITEADILVAPPDIDDLPQIHGAPEVGDEILPAIPLDTHGIKPAKAGAKVGETYGVHFDNDEALLNSALAGGRLLRSNPLRARQPEGSGIPDDVVPPPPPRSFFSDVMVSYSYAGHPLNGMKLAFIGTAMMVVWMIFAMALDARDIRGIVSCGAILSLPTLLFGGYAIQRLWRIFDFTVEGEDEEPLTESGLELWQEFVLPIWWTLVIAGLSISLPFMFLGRIGKLTPETGVIALALWLFGTFITGPMLMQVAAMRSILAVRPDWLISTIKTLGIRVFALWIPTFICLSAWLAFAILTPLVIVSFGWLKVVATIVFPLLSFQVLLWLSYAMFRAAGVVFRHHHEQFPWLNSSRDEALEEESPETFNNPI